MANDVDPASSWLIYKYQVHLEEEDHVVRHKPLAGKILDRETKIDDSGSYMPALLETEIEPNKITGDTDTYDIVQRLSAPSVTVRFTGYAARLGYRINPPRVNKIDGLDVTQVRQRITESQLGGIQGTPIWGLAWDIEYMVITTPTEMPVLANPAMLTDGSESSLR